MERPDLSNIPQDVAAYIRYLENRLEALSSRPEKITSSRIVDPSPSDLPITQESPTNIAILSFSQYGFAKRTFRHLFTRQHRGGMGVFDLEVAAPDQPAGLSTAHLEKYALLITNNARCFRIAVDKFIESEVRAKGFSLIERLPFESGEKIAVILPEQASGYIALASQRGNVRLLRHHLFGEHMKPGVALYNFAEYGSLSSACWTSGDADLFMVSQNGMGIRFSEKLVAPQGALGMKVAENDLITGICSVKSDGAVFIAGADGKGTTRLMSGFAPNKSCGGSGKIAIKNNKVIGAVTLDRGDDLFILSRLGKIIRFDADEVPPTEGVVQGVNCITLRGDEAVAVIKSGSNYP